MFEGFAAMIRIEHIWLGTEPVDKRSGMDRLLMQVVAVFGQAQPHNAYLFANRRATRLKMVVHTSTAFEPRQPLQSRTHHAADPRDSHPQAASLWQEK